MESKRVPRLKALPPEGHPIGIYIGLVVGGLVLAIGALMLFRDLLFAFTREGIKLTDITLFRTLLFLGFSFSSLACFFGFFRLILLQRAQVKKVDEKFKDFTTYARPLIEEVIRQRITSEHLLEKLDKISKGGRITADAPRLKYDTKPLGFREYPKREEFLVFVAILSSITLGLFIYLEMHPWKLVPYSVILLAVAWWFVIAKYFDLVYDIRSYYISALFILLMPSLSIILRAFTEPYKVVYLVFLVMFLYVWSMYTYFKYIDTGAVPEVFYVISAKLMGSPPPRRLKRFIGRETLSPRATELFPPKKYGAPPEKEMDREDISQRINDLFPPRKGEEPPKERREGEKPYQKLREFFSKKKLKK